MMIPLLPLLVIFVILMLGGCVSRNCSTRGSKFIGLFILLAIVGAGLLFHIPRGPRMTLSALPVVSAPMRTARPALPSISTTRQATQDAKLWISDWQSFLNSAKADGQWLRADSAGYFATDAEARKSAYEQAVDVLQGTMYDPSLPPELLRKEIAAALQTSRGLIADENFERVIRPYGDIWRCSLLLNPTRDNARQVKNATLASVQVTRKQQLTTGISVAALMLVIVLTYLFLNAATKGYFVWKLRAAFVMMLIVAVLVISGNIRI